MPYDMAHIMVISISRFEAAEFNKQQNFQEASKHSHPINMASNLVSE